ncbi:hypothetical protein ERJ75_001168300 [Trypanosoma vivax]|nr:hypothetical protein TRVL_06766 [Trypanosoma vivax]KAH8609750.1 hypothetical protein ERJ75_001168300 [Trypanosoma vivax]
MERSAVSAFAAVLALAVAGVYCAEENAADYGSLCGAIGHAHALAAQATQASSGDGEDAAEEALTCVAQAVEEDSKADDEVRACADELVAKVREEQGGDSEHEAVSSDSRTDMQQLAAKVATHFLGQAATHLRRAKSLKALVGQHAAKAIFGDSETPLDVERVILKDTDGILVDSSGSGTYATSRKLSAANAGKALARDAAYLCGSTNGGADCWTAAKSAHNSVLGSGSLSGANIANGEQSNFAAAKARWETIKADCWDTAHNDTTYAQVGETLAALLARLTRGTTKSQAKCLGDNTGSKGEVDYTNCLDSTGKKFKWEDFAWGSHLLEGKKKLETAKRETRLARNAAHHAARTAIERHALAAALQQTDNTNPLNDNQTGSVETDDNTEEHARTETDAQGRGTASKKGKAHTQSGASHSDAQTTGPQCTGRTQADSAHNKGRKRTAATAIAIALGTVRAQE